MSRFSNFTVLEKFPENKLQLEKNDILNKKYLSDRNGLLTEPSK